MLYAHVDHATTRMTVGAPTPLESGSHGCIVQRIGITVALVLYQNHNMLCSLDVLGYAGAVVLN